MERENLLASQEALRARHQPEPLYQQAGRAMITVSAVVFLYAPATTLASVAVLNMDDAGDTAAAAAMAMLIVVTAGLVRLLHAGLSRWLHQHTQAWRG